MKKTLKEFLAFFGVKEGDVVKLNGRTHKVTISENNVPLLGNDLPIQVLVDEEYEIVKPTKVGYLKCGSLKCDDCPLVYLECAPVPEKSTLYDGLNIIFDNKTDNPIYKLVRKELDKDVDPESRPKTTN